MAMAWVDGTDPVLVVNVDGDIRAFQGICSHEYFELDKGFLTARLADLRAAPLAVRPRHGRRARPAGRASDRPLSRWSSRTGRVLIEIPEGPLPVNE